MCFLSIYKENEVARKAKKSKLNFEELLKFIAIVIIAVFFLIYLISKLYSQQLTLTQQEKDRKYYAAQREQLEKEKAELEKQTSKIDSNDYIESIARDKLNMYYPSERLYLDSSARP